MEALDLEHAGLDRGGLEFGLAEGAGVAALDLVADLIEGGGISGGGQLGHAGHRPVELLLHLGLIELSSLVRSAIFFWRARALVSTAPAPGGRLGGALGHGVQILHGRLGADQLGGERARGVLVGGGLGLVAGVARLLGQQQGLTGVGLELLGFLDRPGELQLELALVADHGGSLLREQGVLLPRLLDRLLDLDLRVGYLVELAGSTATR